MEIRNLTKDDMTKVVKLHQYAYGFWSDQEVLVSDHEHLIPENSLGVFENGELLSVMTVLRTIQSIRGVPKKMAGIHMVGTYPEARMKGYVRSLMQSGFLEMKQEGLSVSMLEPFRETFYARFGYVPAYSRQRLKAPLDGLRIPPRGTIGDEWSFERISGNDAKDAYIAFIEDFAFAKYHGLAYNPDIHDAEWTRRNKNRLYVFVKRRGKIEALAKYMIRGYMQYEQEGEIDIHEMYWRNLEAQAALFSFFGKHQDQVNKLLMDIPYGTNYQRWFVDLKERIEIKAWHPWMVRLIDIKDALTDLPAPTKGELTLKVTDPHCGWNNGTYLLQSDSQHLSVSTTKRIPKIEITIHGLSALVYGTHPLEAIELTGWIQGLKKQTRDLLQIWFPEVLLYNPYRF